MAQELFMLMARNAASPIEHFALPDERTVIMGQQIRFCERSRRYSSESPPYSDGRRSANTSASSV